MTDDDAEGEGSPWRRAAEDGLDEETVQVRATGRRPLPEEAARWRATRFILTEKGKAALQVRTSGR